MNAQSLHKWWSTLKSAVFSSSLLLPIFVGAGGQIILTANSPGNLDLPPTCHLSPSLTTFAVSLSEIRLILLDFDPYGGTDPFGMFLLFLKELMFQPPFLVIFFSLLAGGRSMSLQFQNVYHLSGNRGSLNIALLTEGP